MFPRFTYFPKTITPGWLLGGALLCLLSQSACIQHRQLVNFDTGPVFDSLMLPVQPHMLRIQSDDLLAVSVLSQTADPAITAPFRPANPAGGGETEALSYLVDGSGTINMPLIGRVSVVGLSTQDARDSIALRLSTYLKKPIVNVRINNFRFSVLGEVNKAGTYLMPYEQVNILEALGQAGDLTKYGNRENVLVIRQTNGERRYGYINLHQRDLFQSPYFYLEQNDIVYVEPLKAKVGDTADATTKYLQWTLPVISVITLVISLFVK